MYICLFIIYIVCSECINHGSVLKGCAVLKIYYKNIKKIDKINTNKKLYSFGCARVNYKIVKH